MTTDTFLYPRYTNDQLDSVRIYSGTSVSKPMYDYIWSYSVDHLGEMRSRGFFTVGDFLDFSECLSDEGLAAAEKCLEHIAYAELLPIKVAAKDDAAGTFFRVD
jgi:hypothetical protein